MIRRLNQKYFYGGLSSSHKIGIEGSFKFAEKLNIYDEPTQVSVLPAASKVSGNTVDDLVKWIVPGTPYDTNKYFYGDAGKIYKETSGGVWSLLQTTSNSGGQGMEVHDDYIYYTQDTQIGRYGLLSGTPAFDDDWQTGLNDTSDTNFAPIKAFKEGLAVGHGNYLGWWDGATWDEDRVILPPGLEIRTLDVIDEFLVIGTWRGTAITDNEEGFLFFWDGTSTTFNNFVSIPEGGCNAIINSKNDLISVIGSAGHIFKNYLPFENVQPIPKLTLGKYLEVFPGAISNWRNLTLIGVAGNTDSTTVKQGVYTWGSRDTKFPEVLNYAFPISTGTTTGTTLKIGSVKGIGNNAYIGWRDGDTYGVDKVTNSGTPYSEGKIESLLFDNEQLFADKNALVLKATHLPLAADEGIQLGYDINRTGTYTTGDENTTADSTETRLPIPTGRFRELNYECILSCGATSPTLTYLGLEFDDLEEERAY